MTLPGVPAHYIYAMLYAVYQCKNINLAETEAGGPGIAGTSPETDDITRGPRPLSLVISGTELSRDSVTRGNTGPGRGSHAALHSRHAA